MALANEIVLFHVDVPRPPAKPGEVTNPMLWDLCLRSIRKRSPESRITLLTDGKTSLHEGTEGIECIRDESIRLDHLMYDRSRMYLDHVRRREQQCSAEGITFMDIDILVNRPLGDVFNDEFDVGLTYRLDPGIQLEARGLPVNTQVSPINGGVIFCRPTKPAIAFFEEQMRVYDTLHKEGNIPLKMAPDIRQWGGDQYALMAMVGRELVQRKPESLQHSTALVRFLPCDTYNFTPNQGEQLSPQMIAPKFILHMKGPRKQLMPALANWLGV